MQPEGIPAADLMLSSPQEPGLLSPTASTEGVCLEPRSLPSASLAPPVPRALPVQPQERVAAVDVLRGVALMGILAMNIVMFAWPDPCYDNPLAGNNTSVADVVDWAFNHIVFDEKMMTIFSMLFGAGLVLMSERSEARGAALTWIYYRRVFWLLVIGLVHAYLIWHGDILVLYAECGFLLYLFRRRTPRTLIALGTLCVLLPAVLGVGVGLFVRFSEENYWGLFANPPALLTDGTALLNSKIHPSSDQLAEKFQESLNAYRGDYFGIIRQRSKILLIEQTLAFGVATLWMVGGRMLLGMGLMKLDVFSARRSRRFYAWMTGLGYGIGLPLVIGHTWLIIANDFHDSVMIQGGKFLLGYFSAFAIALGHVGVVMLIYQSGAVPWLTRRLAAAGRMALSNYLMQSLICTTLFYGYGFGLYGRIHRPGLVAIVVAIWIFQLSTSIIWLHFFRFGPAEWLWRTLTYWKFQPMLVRVPAVAAPVVSEALTTEQPPAVAHFHGGD
jgi:uncharacterized protein